MRPAGRAILCALSAWHALTAVQNALDTLASTGVAPSARPFAAKNFALLRKSLARFEPTGDTVAALLWSVVAVEAVAASAYAIAAAKGDADSPGFVLSLGLFGAFFLIDDALDDYTLGAGHRATFTMIAAAYAATKAAQR